MNPWYARLVTAIALLVFSFSAFAGQDHDKKETPKQTSELQLVEAKMVCMINERVFDKPQIPIKVDGKTYYGCCEMCKKALGSDPSKRVATDPVSGEEVDKATAVIGSLADGSVLYFENKKNFDAYANRLTKKSE